MTNELKTTAGRFEIGPTYDFDDNGHLVPTQYGATLTPKFGAFCGRDFIFNSRQEAVSAAVNWSE